jgi:tetratricopeptide (TPR) repeat protein
VSSLYNLLPFNLAGKGMIVIIGAGPAGLYTAIKFWQAGVREFVVFDPRAGGYTRPGHLDKKIIDKIEINLGLSVHRKPTEHIKDAERHLYAETQRLGINIQQKTFASLHKEMGNSGIIVENRDGSQEFIKTDYVFDCTGSKRAVVHQANRQLDDCSLKISQIAEAPFPHHFLAYIKMSDADIKSVNGDRAHATPFPDNIPPLAFARAMLKLREFGWNTLLPPRCYAMPFGKGKACLYLHAPADLPIARQNEWLQSVLDCYATDIHFEELPPSKTYRSKPRFMAFTVKLNELEDVAHFEPGVPTIIPLGDAQIDAEYTKGHGISDGIDRINALFTSMRIKEGRVISFNAKLYKEQLKEPLNAHRMAILSEVKKQRGLIKDGPSFIKTRLINALKETAGEQDIVQFSTFLKEIETKEQFIERYENFQKNFGSIYQIKYMLQCLDEQIMTFQTLQSFLFKAITELSAYSGTERQLAIDLLLELSNEWISLGHFAEAREKRPLAIRAYRNAQDIYNLTPVKEFHLIGKLKLFMSLGKLYLAEGHVLECIDILRNAVILAHTDMYAAPLQHKSILLLLSALYRAGTHAKVTKDYDKAINFFKKAQLIVKQYGSTLVPEDLQGVLQMMSKLALTIKPLLDSKFGKFFKTVPIEKQPSTPQISDGIVLGSSL